MNTYIFALFAVITVTLAENKYSKEANQPYIKQKNKSAWTDGSEESPFRMAKINQIWTKARKVCIFVS